MLTLAQVCMQFGFHRRPANDGMVDASISRAAARRYAFLRAESI